MLFKRHQLATKKLKDISKHKTHNKNNVLLNICYIIIIS